MRTIPLTLGPQDYEHPQDRALGRALERNRLFRSFMSKAGSEINAQIATLCLGPLMAESVEVTQRQFPHIYNLFAEMVAIVDIRPMPRLFLHGSTDPQAFTIGIGPQAYVGISSGLVRELEEPGLCFVFGHELGHIRSEHSRITTVAELVAAEWRRNAARVDQSFAEAYLEWSRVSEITADRAGILACQDEETACRALLTMLLGSRSMAAEVNLEEYLHIQSRQVEFNPEALFFQRYNTHPLIPFRLQELLRFSRSPSYERLLSQGMVLGESSAASATRALSPEEIGAIEAIEIELS